MLTLVVLRALQKSLDRIVNLVRPMTIRAPHRVGLTTPARSSASVEDETYQALAAGATLRSVNLVGGGLRPSGRPTRRTTRLAREEEAQRQLQSAQQIDAGASLSAVGGADEGSP